MSEPKHPSTQEKLDAWFDSLPLDKPAPLTGKEKFFRYCIRKKYWLTPVVVFTIPFLLCAVLTILDRYTNLFLICGFTKNECFSFFGGYIGGVATLAGVVLTILHTNKRQSRQEKIASIEKEYDAQARFLSKIDIPQFCSIKYHEFQKIPLSGEVHHLVKTQEIHSSIFRYQEEITQEMIQIGTSSNIFARELPCEKCSHVCNRYKIKKEFLNIFSNEYDKNVLFLQRLQNIFSIKGHIQNLMNVLPSANRNISPEEEKKRCDKLKEDMKYLENESNLLGNAIQERSLDWHSEQFGKLITLIKLYRDEQIKAINHPCPYQQQLF